MPTTCTRKGTNRKVFRIRPTAVLLILLTMVLAKPMVGQSAVESSSDRKILSHIEPTYPETLKRLFIGGTVRVKVGVAANGNVESAELLGGNPILGQAAMKAIKQWKYAPGKAQEKIIVKLEFDPHE
jgi:TonB family protein